MFRFHIPKTHLSFSTLYSRYKPLILLFFFSCCFFAGGLIARIFPASETTLTPASRTFISSSHSFVLPTTENWGLIFQEEGKAPVGNASFDELKKYNAYYARNTDQKVIYLTFDCGYENGNTPSILAALKRHHVPATFFVVGNFLQDNPDLIKQMQKYVSSSRYVTDCDTGNLLKRAFRCRRSFQKDHRKVDDTILPAASGKIQYRKSTDGQRYGISYLLLESRLC